MLKISLGLAVAGVALVPFVAMPELQNVVPAAWRSDSEKTYVVRSATGDTCTLNVVADSSTGKRLVTPQEACAAIDKSLDASPLLA